MEELLRRLETIVKKSAIKIGHYKFPLHSYMYELIFRTKKDGLTLDDICKRLGLYDTGRRLVFYCLLYMVKKGEVEGFHTQKNYFTMRYRIKGKGD